MKQSKKRGFTIVELVIVIAVIGILAGVLIPTFSSVIEKANASARLQEASAALTVALADQTDGALDSGTVIEYKEADDKFWKFKYENGKLTAPTAVASTAETGANKLTSDKITDLSSNITIYLSDTYKAQSAALKTSTTTPSGSGEGGE